MTAHAGRPDRLAAKETLRSHHRELVKLPLQDLLPDLYGDGLITEETQERILHPRAVFVKREVNQLILQDVREAVSNRPEYLDRFLSSLQSLQPAMGLSQRIRGMVFLCLMIYCGCVYIQIHARGIHTQYIPRGRNLLITWIATRFTHCFFTVTKLYCQLQ